MLGLLLRQRRCQLLAQGLLLGRLLTQQLGQVRLMLLLLRGQRLRCGVLQGLGVLALQLRQALLLFALQLRDRAAMLLSQLRQHLLMLLLKLRNLLLAVLLQRRHLRR